MRLILKYRFEFLLLTLVIMILMSPYAIDSALAAWTLGGLLLLTMIGIVFSLLQKRIMFLFACAQAAILSLLYANYLWQGSMMSHLLEMFGNIFFYAFAIAILLHKVLLRRIEGRESIFASLCVYLLIGLTFGLLYYSMEILVPGSFGFAQAVHNGSKIDQFHLIYLSITTLTTVGFGDLLPMTAQARSIMILEQASGVLYLAAFVALIIADFRRQ